MSLAPRQGIITYIYSTAYIIQRTISDHCDIFIEQVYLIQAVVSRYVVGRETGDGRMVTYTHTDGYAQTSYLPCVYK